MPWRFSFKDVRNEENDEEKDSIEDFILCTGMRNAF